MTAAASDSPGPPSSWRVNPLGDSSNPNERGDAAAGCSHIAHQLLGVCAHCPGADAPGREIVGWRRRAIAAAETGAVVLALPDGYDVRLRHCDAPMKLRRANSTWTGKPGQGSENTEAQFVCRSCAATVALSAVTPS